MTSIVFTNETETLYATLDDTVYAREFAAMLPLTVNISDYHGIEKVADLPRKLDTSAAPDSYESKVGDITSYAPWVNLALFYQTFSNSRGLVRLGEFEEAARSGLNTLNGPVRIDLAS